MTKWILISFLFFIVKSTVVAQESEKDSSSSLENLSHSLLQRNITFYHPESKLEAVLLKLSTEQNIKFSYSDDKINNVFLKEAYYSSIDLGLLLSFLLQNTGFKHMVVGRIIVIVESEIIPAKSLPSDTISTPSETTRVFSDSSAGSEKYVSANHIYSPDVNLSKLPAKERKKIQQLYKKEIAWSLRRRRQSQRRFTINDSLAKPKSVPLPGKFMDDLHKFQFYVSGRVGVMKYLPRITENSTYNWEEELNYDYKVKNSIQPAIGFGLVLNHFMVGTGIGYHHLTVEGEGLGLFTKGKSGKTDTINVSFSDKYSVISIPVEVLYFKQKRNLFAGAGLKFELDFIHAKNIQSNKFQSYYTLKDDKAVYYEKNNNVAAVSALNVLVGVVLQKRMVLSAGIEYNYCISPFTENSLYSFYPNSLQVGFSFFYFLNKYDLKRIFSK